jgi:hypothetical protein
VRRTLLLALLFGSIAVRASSQPSELPGAAPVRIGVVDLYPTLALTNFGIDSNVFLQPDQLDPKRDFTFTVTPATDLRIRLGRSRLTGSVKEDLVYYQTYSSESTVNSHLNALFQIPVNRTTLSAGTSFLSTRERPGFEIDVRSQRYETAFNGGLEVHVFPKTFIGLRAQRTKIDYDKDQIFLGSSLQYALNRVETVAALSARYRLTPLTKLMLEASAQQDRFEFSPVRDSDSSRIAAGVTFAQSALLKGSAMVGYRDFRPLSTDLPPYQGVVGNVNLSTVLGPTKVGLTMNRDVQYSYDLAQPYYVQSDATVSVAQHIVGAFDVTGRFGLARLDYQNRTAIDNPLAARTDRVRMFGGGLGYRAARRTRVGFNVDYNGRRSDRLLRQYDGAVMGMTATHVF